MHCRRHCGIYRRVKYLKHARSRFAYSTAEPNDEFRFFNVFSGHVLALCDIALTSTILLHFLAVHQIYFLCWAI